MGRRVAVEDVESYLRGRRLAAGLSQADLAARAGLTRQAVNAIEAGHYVPNTVVALRLAAVLGCRVEELFALPGEAPRLEAELVGEVPATDRVRVQLARVGSRLIARPLTGVDGLRAVADGFVTAPAASSGRTIPVTLEVDPRLIDSTVVVAGCDPALALVGAHLTRHYPSFRLVWVQAGSLAALGALRRGEVHLAGSHLRDPLTGEENVPIVRRELPERRVAVVTLSRWQQGLIVARGNPRGIADGADLLRPDVTVAGREPGSGGRTLLDRLIATAGGTPEGVRGYTHAYPSHLAVAEAVAAGLADTGPGIEAAARAYDLDFIPLQDERFDLVIPVELLGFPPVEALLTVAAGRACRAEVEALGGYDSSAAGTLVAELPA